MKILFMIPSLGGGGAERALVQLVNHYSSSDDITVLSLFHEGNYIKSLNSNIHYKYIFENSFRGNIHLFKLFSPSFLFQKIVKEQYDTIISFLEGPTTRIVSGCNTNTHLINWVHTSPNEKKVLLRSYRSEKEFVKCMKRYSSTAFVADSARKQFLTIFPELHTLNTSIQYNPINDIEIRNQAEHASELQFSPNNFNIVSVGRLSKVKGFERLIRICTKLHQEHNVHLYIIGDGTEKSCLYKQIRESNAGDFISLLGHKANPFPLIAQSNLYVCSSYREGYSTSVIEALILGIPVITTLCSGMEEILGEDSEYGIITQNSELDLYNGILSLIQDESLYQHYRNVAIQRGAFFQLDNEIKSIKKFIANVD